ncbi:MULTISPECIES: DEAD/DEAH box helicase [Pseudomonadota]|nr:DEAD/DEAH box helicase [Achromobacter ruhlandii]PJM86871.1 DEAD/DEAH box helicase [Achromobacter ruhlandii]
MELIDNISRLLGDDLKQVIRPGARLQIGALCFDRPRNSPKIRGQRSE